jgi:putative redox protein
MGTSTVRWTGGQTYIGTDSTNHAVVLSTPAAGIGMKPSDLLLVAVGSCAAVDVVDILTKKKLHLTGLEITVSAEQDDTPPWTFRKIHSHFALRGPDLSPKAVEQAIQLSEEKYCSVVATLRATATVTFDYELLAEE